MTAGHVGHPRASSRPPPMPHPAGALVDIVGKPADANLPIVGHLQQRTMLVRGQNNIDVWGHDAERMATVADRGNPVQDRHRASPRPRWFATARWT